MTASIEPAITVIRSVRNDQLKNTAYGNCSSRIAAMMVLVVLLAFCWTACDDTAASQSVGLSNSPQPENSPEPLQLTFTDSLGHLVTLPGRPTRVVAADGSFAEIWLLAGGQVVGVPEDVQTNGRLPITPDMALIGTIKAPNTEVILGLNPDFVILAADIESHVKLAETLKTYRIPHAFFKVEYFADYLAALRTMTLLTGESNRYATHGTLVQDRIQTTLEKFRSQPVPTVLLIRAFAKGAKAKNTDNATGAMLKDLGADNIADRFPSLLEDISLEQVVMDDPDVILITTMGSAEDALSYLEKGIMANPAWQGLAAVRKKRVFLLPKDLFHYKPNARWDEAYSYLAELLYPEAN